VDIEVMSLTFDPNKPSLLAPTSQLNRHAINSKAYGAFSAADLLSWREKMSIWHRQMAGSHKREHFPPVREVKTEISIETDFISNLTVPVVAYVQKPSIVL
jgi:hypothetical protein